MYKKLTFIRAELGRECRGLLFHCLAHFSNKLKFSELRDLVFEEWQQSTVAERNWSYQLKTSLFFETVKVLSTRQMTFEVYTLFKEFASFMLIGNLPIPNFNYPLTFFINIITV